MTKKLFGGSSSAQGSSNVSGYGALPAELQNYFKGMASQGSDIASNASQYFSPQGINNSETTASNMMQPENFQSSISNYLNPFSNYITDAIDTGYQSQFGALKQQADEAGAFGGSRYRTSMGDLDQSRLSLIGQLMGGQFNNAAGQMQNGISNLLGFGGLQRGVDFAQRQALPNALNFQSGIMNPLLGGGSSSSYGKSDTEGGIIPGLTNFFKPAPK